MTQVSAERQERIAQASAWIAKTKDEPAADLLSRTRHMRQKFLAELDGLSEAQRTFSPGEGQWCVEEVCRHMSNALRAVSRAIESLAAGRKLPDIGPEGLGILDPHPGSFDAVRRGVEEGFDASEKAAERLASDADLSVTLKHPVFGPLNCREWLAFNLMHVNVHVNQIRRIKGSPGYPS